MYHAITLLFRAVWNLVGHAMNFDSKSYRKSLKCFNQREDMLHLHFEKHHSMECNIKIFETSQNGYHKTI
jgi:hypothetical protein